MARSWFNRLLRPLAARPDGLLQLGGRDGDVAGSGQDLRSSYLEDATQRQDSTDQQDTDDNASVTGEAAPVASGWLFQSDDAMPSGDIVATPSVTMSFHSGTNIAAGSTAPGTQSRGDANVPPQRKSAGDEAGASRTSDTSDEIDADASDAQASERAGDEQSSRASEIRQTDVLKQWRAISRRELVVVAIFSFVINLLMLTIPIYLFQLSDRVLTSRSLDTLLMLTAIAVMFLTVLSLLDIARRQLLSRLAAKLEKLFSGPVLAAVVHHAQTGHSGGIAAMRSLQQVRTFLASPLMLVLFDAPMAPLYFFAVFLIHPHLGFILLGSAVLLFAIAVFNQWMTAGMLSESSQYTAKADAQAEALAHNAQVVNAMGMLNEGILQWGREQARAIIQQMQAQDRNFYISGTSKFIRLLTQIAMLGWGAYLAMTGRITGGTMIAASIIGGRALQPVESMIEGWRNLIQTRGSYGRIIAMVETLQRETPRLLLPRPKGHLSVDKLLYITPTTKEPVLNGVTFDLMPGEALAIVGPSGSGKSTLAKIIVGCLLPTAGTVRLDQTELKNWDRRQFGEYTGYLPQEVELFPGTIKANISRMRDDLPDQLVYDAAAMTQVHEVIAHLQRGYETIIDAAGSPLSGGQRQRIALARAFFGDPVMVVLDEPNSNLDSVGEEALAETLRRAKASKTTVVAVTQRPALLQCVDKVLVLRGGRVEAFGSPQEVLHRVVRPAAMRNQQPPAGQTGEQPRA